MPGAAELLTIIVSGTLRRNVLGAIASDKIDCNFPKRSDDNRAGARNRDDRQSAGITAANELEEDATYARRYPYGATQKKTVFPLTNSFRKVTSASATSVGVSGRSSLRI